MMRSRFALATVLVLFGCAAMPQRPWNVEITTSGGFTGRGNGGIRIDSDGTITVTAFGGGRCSFKATAEELKQFESVLAQARPEAWRESYAPENKCCDRIEYVLTLTIVDKKYTTSWIDAPQPMPKDLTALIEALQKLKQRCRPEPR